MRLAFTKMHGIGNDFVVVDNMSRTLELSAEQVRRIADRRRGVGCDQLLVAEPASGAEAAVRLRIWNSDGEEVGQCGNGVRCLAEFVREAGHVDGDEIVIETGARLVRARSLGDGRVRVDMGIPGFEPRDIPFFAEARAAGYALRVNGHELDIGAVSMGNPHAVLRVDDTATAPVETLGPLIQHCGRFPEGVNVGFMTVESPRRARLRVFERGVGETLACGSGACAAMAVGRLRGWLEIDAEIVLPGGTLELSWQGEGQPIWMTGPTERAFDGEIDI
ncbi:MAG: diaminopimelate epimerase [Gammaproteobacteria bacterium]|nr:diaminopimelate epimerase [Gammaproteobacteria bacterium]